VEQKKMRILVLAPHTDDETLGCGGSIAKFIERGSEVRVYAFSCGTSNSNEFINACKRLKADSFILKQYPTRSFDQHRQEILDQLIEIRKEFNPHVVFVPAKSDIHQDHQVICNEAMRAFKHSTIYGMEFGWNSFNFANHCYNVLSPDHLTQKIVAMQEYSTQSQRVYFKEENVISMARVRGMQAGTEYAECFEVIRQFL
jgi:LmbE family N-acetylglucosaminyl deacetylase